MFSFKLFRETFMKKEYGVVSLLEMRILTG